MQTNDNTINYINNYIIDNRYLNEINLIISPYIINYIYRDLYELPQFNFIIPVSRPILLPRFVEANIEIPENAVCGITFERPDCKTSCGHYFCRVDLTTWLENQKNECKKMTCPSCRADITQVFVLLVVLT
jgi:hypothetical protein